MGEISIKINIADRVYPLKVSMEEEEIVRRAAKLINDRIKEFQENYAVRDKQDVYKRQAYFVAPTLSPAAGIWLRAGPRSGCGCAYRSGRDCPRGIV